LSVPPRDTTSTQQAFGDTMSALARDEGVGRLLVTASPDVSVSTNLGGWINRVGAFALREPDGLAEEQGVLRWRPSPNGQHVELGISEMNLFMLLSQFGLTAELFGEAIVPIGTVYDPFVCRGLDALIYACYVGARFVVVGTPSGVSLSPEGGAHQSAITVSIGTELPGLRTYEPAFAAEVPICLLEGVRGCLDRADGHSTYLRLSTRPVDQAVLAHAVQRLGPDEHARQVLAGGYRLLESEMLAPATVAGGLGVQVVASGAVVTEAVAACQALWAEGVAADLIVVTSVERLAHEHHALRRRAAASHEPDGVSHLETLFPPAKRGTPIVTVLDGAPHALSFLGSVFGAPVVPLGVDEFGQSGALEDLYRHVGIDAAQILDAALLALDIGAERARWAAAPGA
jgi:pyruvate dehydrogenase E1 component